MPEIISFMDFYDNRYGTSWVVKSGASLDSGQYLRIYFYPNLGGVSTLSSSNYLDLYLSPYFQIDAAFDQNTDCRINGNTNSCQVTIIKNPNYIRLTIKSNATWAIANPYMFQHQTYTYINLYKVWPTLSSTNKNIYQYYSTLYKSDVVDPVAYHAGAFIHAMPTYDGMSGLALSYVNNYLTSASINFQTYPGALRLECTDPSQLNALIVQPN